MVDSATDRHPELKTYLVRLRALSEKIAQAITALEHNDLPQFQASLAEQEAICSELSPWTDASFATKDVDPALLEQIKEVRTSLIRSNRVYAALLKRVNQTKGLMMGLYRSYAAGHDETRPAVAEPHTWSCEI